MFEALAVTLLPVVFLTILFVGKEFFRKRNIDMDGEPLIERRLFYGSKYMIVLLWAAMVMSSWGVNLAFTERPRFLKWAALCLWAAGFILLFSGRFELGSSFRIGRAKESTGLQANGLFRMSRNPMYLGVYMTLLASVLYTMNPVLLLLGVFVVYAHHRIVLAEEKHLRNVFGEEYRNYCRRVRRYL
jgi:protein-S-isoprenylcysteine O-methyltransferase Ste14